MPKLPEQSPLISKALKENPTPLNPSGLDGVFIGSVLIFAGLLPSLSPNSLEELKVLAQRTLETGLAFFSIGLFVLAAKNMRSLCDKRK